MILLQSKDDAERMMLIGSQASFKFKHEDNSLKIKILRRIGCTIS